MKRLKNWLRWLVIAAACYGTWGGEPVLGQQPAPVAQEACVPSQQAFDTAYWLAQPPALRGLQGGNAGNVQLAAQLAVQGYVVDTQIMVWGWDPCLVMKLRKDFGYTWVPNALQPGVQIAPGVGMPGTLTPYDPSNPPAGSIKVTINAADLKPFDPPPPPKPVVTITDPVGAQSIGNIYLPVAGDASAEGTTFTDDRGTFIKRVVVTPFGKNVYWEKQ